MSNRFKQFEVNEIYLFRRGEESRNQLNVASHLIEVLVGQDLRLREAFQDVRDLRHSTGQKLFALIVLSSVMPKDLLLI